MTYPEVRERKSLSTTPDGKKRPDFPWKTEDHWPQQPLSHATFDCGNPELKKEAKPFTASAGNNADMIDQMIQYFSSWFELTKHLAWILRYRSKLLSASQKTGKKQEIIFSTDLCQSQPKKYSVQKSKSSNTFGDGFLRE